VQIKRELSARINAFSEWKKRQSLNSFERFVFLDGPEAAGMHQVATCWGFRSRIRTIINNKLLAIHNKSSPICVSFWLPYKDVAIEDIAFRQVELETAQGRRQSPYYAIAHRKLALTWISYSSGDPQS
jgi:hypothetical protein